eukprot:12254100-Alexandrium_andersonii.AAC.1
MSASLVGSEMCIRDRSGGAVAPPGRKREKLLKSAERCLKLFEAVWSCTVSYTHLTLPTICSV